MTPSTPACMTMQGSQPGVAKFGPCSIPHTLLPEAFPARTPLMRRHRAAVILPTLSQVIPAWTLRLTPMRSQSRVVPMASATTTTSARAPGTPRSLTDKTITGLCMGVARGMSATARTRRKPWAVTIMMWRTGGVMPTSVKALKGRDLPTEKEASLYSDLLGGRGCLQLGDPW